MTTPKRPSPAMVPDAMLDACVAQVRELPLRSPLAQHVTTMLDDPHISMQEVARVISQDPTLALRVLRTVNSAYFALSEPVTQVARAVQLVGFTTLRDMLDQQSLLNLFALRPRSRPAISARIAGLWQHAVATGVAARELARHMGVAENATKYSEFWAAGMLHDIGKVALLLFRSADYERCLWVAASENIAIVDAERRLLDYDHAQLGKKICQSWGQPDEIANAIGRHHSVRSTNTEGVYSEVTAVIHVADILARTLGAGWWGDRNMPRLDPAARDLLHLRAADAVALLEAIEGAYVPTLASLSAIFCEIEIA